MLAQSPAFTFSSAAGGRRQILSYLLSRHQIFVQYFMFGGRHDYNCRLSTFGLKGGEDGRSERDLKRMDRCSRKVIAVISSATLFCFVEPELNGSWVIKDMYTFHLALRQVYV